jgi:hypothetical protein
MRTELPGNEFEFDVWRSPWLVHMKCYSRRYIIECYQFLDLREKIFKCQGATNNNTMTNQQKVAFAQW